MTGLRLGRNDVLAALLVGSSRSWLLTREQSLKPVQVLLIRRLCDVPDAVGDRAVFELLSPFDRRSTCARRESNPQHVTRRRHVVDDHGGRSLQLEKDTFIGMVRAARSMHHELPAAANSELEHLEGVREAVRSPPAREQFGVGEGFEDSLWRMAQHSMAP